MQPAYRIDELPLGPRQKQVLILWGQGMDQNGIAAHLNVSPFTIHNTFAIIRQKMAAKSMGQALVNALKDGQLKISDM